MNNREIDRQIAELMGFKVQLHTGVHNAHSDMTLYDLIGPDGKKLALEGNEIIAWQYVPQYSTNWNAMRLLVEFLLGKRLRTEIFITKERCEVVLYGDGSSERAYLAETAPLALCKAVLSLRLEVLR